jgi:predicted ATPase/transcriptional regulator with XRE-family HTH domain
MPQFASFGQWLGRRRRALDLTQAELAARVGCSVETVQKIEVDARRPSKPMAERLSECLGVAEADRSRVVGLARGLAVTPVGLAGQIDPVVAGVGAGAHLPLAPTPLIGREREQAVLRRRLVGEGVRLLTLTGPGGIGKTRLALQVAADLVEHYGHGVRFVPLAAARGTDAVGPAIVRCLALADAGGDGAAERLREYLRERHLLLVLDNAEHLVDAAPLVGELLAACPWLQVLATSRAPLRLRAERRFSVPPLELAEPGGTDPAALAAAPAVALFVERARAVRPAFALCASNAAAVAAICARLDGMPLAIELAAARMSHLPADALLARLGQRLPLLTTGGPDMPARHRTLRDTIGWSYDLLPPAEQRLFRRLALFDGGGTFAGAEVVCADLAARPDAGTEDVLDGLAALIDGSLLLGRTGPGGEPRFAMLETIREFAVERLEASGELATMRRRHAAYFAERAEALAAEQQRFEDVGIDVALDRVEADLDNLRAALRWADEAGEIETGLRIGAGLDQFWYYRGYLVEGQAWLAGALARAAEVGAVDRPGLRRARAAALKAIGNMARYQGDVAAARSYWEDALALLNDLGERRAVAHVLRNLGSALTQQGDLAAARVRLDESMAIYRETGDRPGVAMALFHLGFLALAEGDAATAQARCQESLALARAIGNRALVAYSLFHLGRVCAQQGDDAAARARFEECLSIDRALGLRGQVRSPLAQLVALDVRRGDHAAARGRVAAILADGGPGGDREATRAGLISAAQLAVAQGDAARALRLAGAAGVGAPGQPPGLLFWLPDVERSLAVAREALGEEAAACAWTQGRSMATGDAVDLALSDCA